MANNNSTQQSPLLANVIPYEEKFEIIARDHYGIDTINNSRANWLSILESKMGADKNIKVIKANNAYEKMSSWQGPFGRNSNRVNQHDCAVQCGIFFKGTSNNNNRTMVQKVLQRGIGMNPAETQAYLEEIINKQKWPEEEKDMILLTKLVPIEISSIPLTESTLHYQFLYMLKKELENDQYTLACFSKEKDLGHVVIIAKIEDRIILFDPQKQDQSIIDIDYDVNSDGCTCNIQENGFPSATNFTRYIRANKYINFDLLYHIERDDSSELDTILIQGIEQMFGNKRKIQDEASISIRNINNENPKKIQKGIFNENKAKQPLQFHPGKKDEGPSKKRQSKKRSPIRGGKWTKKYKKSINCKKPKGFSQKQHCKYGRKKFKKQSRKMKGGHLSTRKVTWRGKVRNVYQLDPDDYTPEEKHIYRYAFSENDDINLDRIHDEWYIFVILMDTEGNVFMYLDEAEPDGRPTNHALIAGDRDSSKAILAAGEFIWKSATSKLTITNQSGHYKPNEYDVKDIILEFLINQNIFVHFSYVQDNGMVDHGNTDEVYYIHNGKATKIEMENNGGYDTNEALTDFAKNWANGGGSKKNRKFKKQSRKIKGGHHELLVAPILVAASYIDKYRNKKYKKQTKKQTKK